MALITINYGRDGGIMEYKPKDDIELAEFMVSMDDNKVKMFSFITRDDKTVYVTKKKIVWVDVIGEGENNNV